MRWLKKWVKDCIYTALEDKKNFVTASRNPCKWDDLAHQSKWVNDDTKQVFFAERRETIWIEIPENDEKIYFLDK